LVDLALLIGSGGLDKQRILDALRLTFERRGTHDLPMTAKLRKVFNARAADSPNRWSRVNKQVKPVAAAAETNSPFESAFQPRFAAVSQDTPSSLNVWIRWPNPITVATGNGAERQRGSLTGAVLAATMPSPAPRRALFSTHQSLG
jgi:hypothetical protein